MMSIRLIMTIILVSQVTFSFAQRRHSAKAAIENSKCEHYDKYSISERHGFYPFNEAKEVWLISFDDPSFDQNKIPLSNKILDTLKIKESIILNARQLENLTDVLYNYKFNTKYPKNSDSDSKCYNPRNAIVFFNERKEVFEYLEICFECDKIELSSEEIKVWSECTEKIELIRKFFILSGIKIGANLQN